MKNKVLYIFLIIWFGALTFLNVYVTTRRTQNLHAKIDNISDSLNELKKNNTLAVYTVKTLKKDIQKYKTENLILQKQKDSILLKIKEKNIKNYQKLNEIKRQQKDLNKLLEKLRKENEKYQ